VTELAVVDGISIPRSNMKREIEIKRSLGRWTKEKSGDNYVFVGSGFVYVASPRTPFRFPV